MAVESSTINELDTRYVEHSISASPMILSGEGKSHTATESQDLDSTFVAADTTFSNKEQQLASHNKFDSVVSSPTAPQPDLPVIDSDNVDIDSYAADTTQEITLVTENELEGKEKGGGGEDSRNEMNLQSKIPRSPARSPARPNLQLNIKPPSPQPWDIIDPNTDNMKATALSIPASAGGYSPAPSQRFGAMQAAAGNGRPLIPKSSYYFGPPPPDSAYGTPPVGQIGVHHPREVLRIERDYTGGEVIQFAPIYPLELENRLTPTQFLESINAINETLISAHSQKHAFVDNLTTVVTLQLSRLFLTTHFEKELGRLRRVIDDLNATLFNPVGLNILWPGDVAFLYLDIEYY